MYIHSIKEKKKEKKMPQMIPFYFFNEIVFSFIILIIILYILSKFVLPRFVRLFISRIFLLSGGITNKKK